MSEVKRAVAMAAILLQKRAAVVAADLALKALNEEVRKLEQEDLPDLMRELELKSFTMDDGAIVSVNEDITCGITEEQKAKAHAWLVKHNFGALIKTEVKVAFPAGELEAATEFAADNNGDLKEFVHPMTLKSFLKEQMAAGTALPMEVFGVREFNRVKIELPKPKKAKATR